MARNWSCLLQSSVPKTLSFRCYFDGKPAPVSPISCATWGILVASVSCTVFYCQNCTRVSFLIWPISFHLHQYNFLNSSHGSKGEFVLCPIFLKTLLQSKITGYKSSHYIKYDTFLWPSFTFHLPYVQILFHVLNHKSNVKSNATCWDLWWGQILQKKGQF